MNATACAPYDANLKMGRFEFNFKALQANVKKLQIRIVKVQQTGRHNKVKALQWLLAHSLIPCLATVMMSL
jgi:RNA-directed DNA polymerase